MTAASTAVPLSAELRARTAQAHAAAEGSPFFAALAQGKVTRRQVAALLSRLLPVYTALEQAAERWRSDPEVGALVLPGLERTARLRADLAALPAAAGGRSPASDAYAERVAAVTPASRAAFAAHHYTRLLGDLSGGQAVRASLRLTLGLDETNGGSFFAFPGLRPAAAGQAYRAALDALPLTGAERSELVEECLVAYALNTALARELDEDARRPTWPSR